MSRNENVLVAMSGGVDSSMVALMLKKQGYGVVGATMKIGDTAIDMGGRENSTCCSIDAINDAREVAVSHDFPHYVIDLQEQFQEVVVDHFVDEYMAGRTPNPCVVCNREVKWGSLLRKADKLGCKYIATGHYARVKQVNDRYYISKAADAHKDQSYYLWGLPQEFLARTLFPLGNYQKSETKELAREWGFDDIANKEESVDVCFIPTQDYQTYLRERKPSLKALEGGKFVTSDGTVVGRHKGYPFYTIGQRKGLGVALGERVYVTDIRPETNTIEIGPREELHMKGMWVNNLNLQKYGYLPDGLRAHTKIRYNDNGTMAKLYPEKEHVKVLFEDFAQGIAPGQSAVFYDGDDVIGGGRIGSSFKLEASKPEAEVHASA